MSKIYLGNNLLADSDGGGCELHFHFYKNGNIIY